MEKSTSIKQQKKKEKSKKNKEDSDQNASLHEPPINTPFLEVNNDETFLLTLFFLTKAKVSHLEIGPDLLGTQWDQIAELLVKNTDVTRLTLKKTQFDQGSTVLKNLKQILGLTASIKEFELIDGDRNRTKISTYSIKALFDILQESPVESLRFDYLRLDNDTQCEMFTELIAQKKNLKSISVLDFPALQWHVLLKAIKSNQSITSIGLGNVDLTPALQHKLKKLLPRLTKFSLIDCTFTPNMDKYLFFGNESITSLEISNVENAVLAPMIKELKSLTELSIKRQSIDAVANDLAEALTDKNLKHLSFRCQISEGSCALIMTALASTTTLESIVLDESNVSGESIGKFLLTNRSVHTLKILANLLCLTINELANALKVNTTLTELTLTECRPTQQSIINLSEALRVNNTLEKLTVDIQGPKELIEVFLMSLKHNSALTSLDVQFIRVTDDYLGVSVATNAVSNMVIDLLKSNEAIREFHVRHESGRGYFTYDVAEEKVEAVLKKNIEKRNNMMQRTVRTMKTVILRPHMFGVAVPLEIWQMVFSHLHFEALPKTDFGTLFGQVLSKMK